MISERKTALDIEHLPPRDKLPNRKMVVIVDEIVQSFNERPRRFMDVMEEDKESGIIVIAIRRFKDDEQLERSRHSLRRSQSLDLFRVLVKITSNLRLLNSADYIYCRSPISYYLLLHLARFGLFKARDKVVCRVIFRMRGFLRILPVFQKAPDAFRIQMITHEQVCEAKKLSGANDRIGLLEWRIDTEWYRPSPGRSAKQWFLVPGNAERDDDLVESLVEEGFHIVRAGRSEGLEARFTHLVEKENFRLEINLCHLQYLRLLQSVSAVILPIKECDEPAGVTACLEGLSCELPVFATASLGVENILNAVPGLSPPIQQNSKTEWVARLNAFQNGDSHADSDSLKRGRDYVVAQHSIKDDNADWLAIFDLGAPR